MTKTRSTRTTKISPSPWWVHPTHQAKVQQSNSTTRAGHTPQKKPPQNRGSQRWFPRQPTIFLLTTLPKPPPPPLLSVFVPSRSRSLPSYFWPTDEDTDGKGQDRGRSRLFPASLVSVYIVKRLGVGMGKAWRPLEGSLYAIMLPTFSFNLLSFFCGAFKQRKRPGPSVKGACLHVWPFLALYFIFFIFFSLGLCGVKRKMRRKGVERSFYVSFLPFGIVARARGGNLGAG